MNQTAVRRADEIHDLTNSNLTKVKEELATMTHNFERALDRIETLEKALVNARARKP